MSCEASNCGSGEVLYAKRTLFPPLLNSTREARQSLVRVSIPQRDNLFCVLFFGTIWPHFRSEKKSCRNGSGPHVPGETTRHIPSMALKLAARTLSLVEHTISKFGGDPCPVRRRLVAAAKCYVRKARFFLCRQRTEKIHHY